ncbi:MAG: bifunctional nuclease family protein [Halobacteriales archaeon]
MNAAIDAVRVAGTPDGPVPVVILAPDDDETAGDDVLPIFIGFDEAVSIARGLDAEGIGRPLTHDLMLDVIEELGGRVERIVVSAIVEDTYIADLHLNTPRGNDVVVDARPSDSLALAARTNAPIEINEDVFDEGRQDRSEFDDLEPIQEVVDLP